MSHRCGFPRTLVPRTLAIRQISKAFSELSALEKLSKSRCLCGCLLWEWGQQEGLEDLEGIHQRPHTVKLGPRLGTEVRVLVPTPDTDSELQAVPASSGPTFPWRSERESVLWAGKPNGRD